ncbi:MAG: hypothetical protein KatS3mg003_1541 [Candidatus Nitrosocaldaceae archaeon]|nr:MAG: hypothetical protein KatS3mg003_0757 [Candidatus Nitrosocaldaceae archaeon]GIU72062.1 MAG: hypothetical protein KatS3mg003_1541 [Candidatus Nitrosocaldaceae archaeon]
MNKKKQFAMKYGLNILYHANKYGLIETLEIIIKKIAQYKNAGIDQLLLAFQDPLDIYIEIVHGYN